MADCSLDDYIKQKGIGVNLKKRTAAGIKTDAAGARIKILPPSNGKKTFLRNPITAPPSAKPTPRVDARQWLSDPITKHLGIQSHKVGVASRLSGAPAATVRAVPRIGSGAPPLMSPNSGGTVSDARQKILAKTKFADARQRILNKKDGSAASVPAFFDVRQKLEAKRGISSAPPLFPPSSQLTPVSLFAPPDTQRTFAWGAPVAPLGGQPGVMNFDGNIVKTVNYPTQLVSVPQPLLGNPVQHRITNTEILQNNARLQITMRNDQRATSVVSAQKPPFQQNVFTLPPSSRITFGKAVEQQPIQTVLSQPPIKLISKPQTTISTQLRLATAAATVEKHSEVELASPLQGFRIHVSNLHPNVTHEDITELFGAVGALKRARMVKAGHAEVVYVNREDAVSAVAKYHMRELDGVPMNLAADESRRPSTTALSDLQQHQPLRLNKTVPAQVVELDPNILHKALFKTASEKAPLKPVSFTVHM